MSKQRRPDVLEQAIYVGLYVVVAAIAAGVVAASYVAVRNAPQHWAGAVVVAVIGAAITGAAVAVRGPLAEARSAVARSITATGEAWVQGGIAQDAEKRLRDSGQTPVVEDIGVDDIERVEGARAVNAVPAQLGVYDWSLDLGDEGLAS